jgi:hypothetical protein
MGARVFFDQPLLEGEWQEQELEPARSAAV